MPLVSVCLAEIRRVCGICANATDRDASRYRHRSSALSAVAENRDEFGAAGDICGHSAAAAATDPGRQGFRSDRRSLFLSGRGCRSSARPGIESSCGRHGARERSQSDPAYAVPRRWIQWAAATRSRPCHGFGRLEAAAGRAGDAARARARAAQWGRSDAFCPPADREAARRALGFTRPTLLAVGNLIALKRHALIIEALADLPEIDLAIAGDGPERPRIEALARQLGLADRVRLLGRLPQERLPGIYGAADLLVHPSVREGWPNVLLESMACGTPVLATNFDSVGEIVGAPEAGRIVAEATPDRPGRRYRRAACGTPAARGDSTLCREFRLASHDRWANRAVSRYLQCWRDGLVGIRRSSGTVEPRPERSLCVRVLTRNSPKWQRSVPAAKRRPAPRSSRPTAPAVHCETIARRARFRPRWPISGIGTSRLVPSEIVIGRSVVSRTVRHGMPR